MRHEKWFSDDSRIIRQKTTDPTPVLDQAAALRSAEVKGFGSENRLVGRIDGHVLEMWLKEAGVRFDDKPAVREVIRKKLLCGENSAFRVWGGTF